MPKITVYHPDTPPVKYALNGRAFTVGRSPDNDIVLSGGGASSHHAVFKLLPTGDFAVTDLGSTNQTKVNGLVVQTAPLRNGDRILFGDIEVLYESEVPAPPFADDQPTRIYDPAMTVPPAQAQAPAPAGARPVPYVIHRPYATRSGRRRRVQDGGCLMAAVICAVIVAGFAAGLIWRHYATHDGEWLWTYLRNLLHGR